MLKVNDASKSLDSVMGHAYGLRYVALRELVFRSNIARFDQPVSIDAYELVHFTSDGSYVRRRALAGAREHGHPVCLHVGMVLIQ